ncbi:hypothetical protein Tco_1305464 [Tanacetum coccineum]
MSRRPIQRIQRKYQLFDFPADPKMTTIVLVRQLGTWYPNLLNLEKGQVIGDSQQGGQQSPRVEGEEIEEHGQQCQTKGTPKKLTYNDFEGDDSEISRARNSSERSFDGSSGITRTQSKTWSIRKGQRSLSWSKTPSKSSSIEKMGGKSRSKIKLKDGRAKSRPRRLKPRGTSSDSSYEGDSEDMCEDLSTSYKRTKPTPFTLRSLALGITEGLISLRL